ncbi:MAG: carboxypeptidase-like regulatory domain-containing protein, partial [Acidobacteriota bacterium]|nr:carboxypeptidase-like regulatory domain-containing protein [Acidobacteriota bacterium]
MSYILNAKRSAKFALYCVTILVAATSSLSAFNSVRPQSGSIKGTVSVTTGATNTRPELLPGALLTLVNRDLPKQSMKAVTDDAGAFIFANLPAATYLLTVEAKGLPTVTREIRLEYGTALTV